VDLIGIDDLKQPIEQHHLARSARPDSVRQRGLGQQSAQPGRRD
jgi:hypothetical protein